MIDGGPTSATPDSLDLPPPVESDSLVRAVAAAPVRAPRSGRREILAAGTVVDGAYRIESELGHGAMGVVYVATDLTLDRRVALKLHASAQDEAATSRMWREARAMARLADPHVITVHEVGVHDGRVYIAMELVDGVTLADWNQPPRPWRQVLDAYVQAARGLAAAHRVGLVHRDFKPTNVLVGRDGRVRVADFGLARVSGEAGARGEATSSSSSSSGSGDPNPDSDARLTRTGVAVGTPAYMSPEQLDGGAADHRSDQYSFFVALHEALYGVPPFEADSLRELIRAAAAGRVRPPSTDRSVPQWLRTIVLRGLRPAATDRFADMDAVVRALQSDPTRRRRMIVAAAGGTALVGGLMFASARVAGDGPSCADGIALPWDDQARDRVAAALRATGLPYAEDTRARVEGVLDEYTAQLGAASVRACESREAALADELATARALCLGGREQALGALVEVLAVTSTATLERAVAAATGLPAVASCEDLDYLAAAVKPPDDPALAAAVERVRAQLARAHALERAGAFETGFTEAQAAAATADELDHGPLVGEALLRVGQLADGAGRYPDAEAKLREAYAQAIASGDDRTATEAAVRLAYVVGHQLARHDEGLQWGWVATAQLRRLGSPGPMQAMLLNNLGAIHQVRGEFAESIAHYRRALAIHDDASNPNQVERARAFHNLGNALRYAGDLPASREHYLQALALREQALGPTHPAVASTLAGLATTAFLAGDLAGAIAEARRALAIREGALGPDHPDVAALLGNLGAFLERSGDYEGAMVQHRRALAIEQRAFGPEHPAVASTIENIANVDFARGDFEAAIVGYSQALTIREKTLGTDHPDIGVAATNLGLAYGELGQYDRALEFHRRAADVEERRLGPDHPDFAGSLENIGNIHEVMGRHDEALAHHTRALAIREKALGAEHPAIAQSHMNLGNAYEGRGEPQRALELHEGALAMLERIHGREHPDVALAAFNVGQARLALGQGAAAVTALERALVLRGQFDTPSAVLADTRYELARAIVLAGGDRGRARALAEQARDGYGPSPTETALRDEVDRWLRALGR